jgi:hypothetical protein
MAKLVIMPGPSVKDYKLENPRIFQNTTYMYNYQYIDPFAITTDITDQCRRKNDKSRSVVTAAEILIDKGLMKNPSTSTIPRDISIRRSESQQTCKSQ